MIKNQIRNIIFDLGGVVLNIDYSKTAKAFINLGITNFNDLYTQLHAGPLFTELECGRIEPDDFVVELNKYSPRPLSQEEVFTAWNAMLLDFPPQRIALLKELKTKYRTFLLSNTNAIHHKEFLSLYRETIPEGKLDDCFEKAYYSHEIGLRKPNKEAYQFVLDQNNLKPEETMFIDDTLPNVEAANALGIQGFFLHPPQQLADIV